jgi:nicotinate-nucleotide adenylyltransferase
MIVHAGAKKPKKIGLLGGTFDPVHNGHLAVADHVLNVLNLEGIWFIPAALPPHKPGHVDDLEITSYGHRFAMLERAVAVNSSFIVSDIESKRATPSYSIDTINILIQSSQEPIIFYFIIGADAFLEIDTWKRFKELPDLVNFIVISRPGYPLEKVAGIIRSNYPDYTCDQAGETWHSEKSNGDFILLSMNPVPVSSTVIRQRVRQGEPITGMVPAEVEHYILEQKLYCR